MKKPITVEEVREAFDYNAESGSLTWRERPAINGYIRHQNKMRAGKKAGGPSGHGYEKIYFMGGFRYTHHLVWIHQQGEAAALHIDHINNDKSDNRIENLRLATRSQNLCNRPMQSNNSLGAKGVSRNRSRYSAKIRVDNVRTHLGTFDTVEEAHSAYCAAAETFHGQFAKV